MSSGLLNRRPRSAERLPSSAKFRTQTRVSSRAISVVSKASTTANSGMLWGRGDVAMLDLTHGLPAVVVMDRLSEKGTVFRNGESGGDGSVLCLHRGSRRAEVRHVGRAYVDCLAPTVQPALLSLA